MKEVNELSEWADNLIDEGAAVDAYMAGKSPALAHFADKLDKEVDEGILDTVKKVGSKVFDKLGGGSEEDLIKDLQKSAGVKVTGKKPEFDVKAKELSRDNPSDPAGNFMKGGKDLGIFKEEGLDPAQAADQKINTPAVFRKEKDSFSIHKSNNDDDGAVKIQGSNWKVTPQDLAKADEKNITSPSGMSALKKRMNTIEEDEVDESALQASFGIKKYGKKGMDKLRAAGQKHASEKTMQNIRAEFSDKEKPVTEGQEDLDIIKRLVRK
jgi:hypothetical protein